MSNQDYILVKSFLIIISKPGNENYQDPNFGSGHLDNYRTFRSDDKTLTVAFEARDTETGSDLKKNGHQFNILFGDDSEYKSQGKAGFMANGVCVQADLANSELCVFSSIVGLPAVYVYHHENKIVIASDIYLISQLRDVQLYYNYQSIYEFGYFGYPINYRTLFKNIEMVKPGSMLQLSDEGRLSIISEWRYEENDLCKNWDEYLEMQEDAFNDAFDSMDLNNTFLSLTGGLDTRAILAACIDRQKSLPAYTMSGENLTLDTRIAKKLCRQYGYQHDTVLLDATFNDNLLELSIEASKLSGGISSFSQSHEIFFYENVPGSYGSRLSGNLGNQIGRGGTEGVSIRNADLGIINEHLHKDISLHEKHWFSESEYKNTKDFYMFLLKKEIPFSSVANYAIGNSFMIQKSPYASRKLIETTSKRPDLNNKKNQISIRNLMIKDLKHRVFGENRKESFQLKYIQNIGGYVSDCPINWGANANGKLTLYGSLYGLFSFLDIIVAKKFESNKSIQKLSDVCNIAGIHVYLRRDADYKERMYDIVRDIMNSKNVLESGLFNKKLLMRKIDKTFKSKNHSLNDIIFALDLAIATNVYGAKI